LRCWIYSLYAVVRFVADFISLMFRQGPDETANRRNVVYDEKTGHVILLLRSNAPSIQVFLYITALRSCCRFGNSQPVNRSCDEGCFARDHNKLSVDREKGGSSPVTARLLIVQDVENALVQYCARS
jgi:hypothetical protein